MGQRIYILSKLDKWNVLGVYTNIRQVHKAVSILNPENLDEIILQEYKMNENPLENNGKECKYMLIKKREELIKHQERLLKLNNIEQG